MDTKILACLSDDLTLVNDRLSHTIWWVGVSANSSLPDFPHPAKITLTLTCDEPQEPFYTVTCCGIERATCVLWQLCGIALLQFSFNAFPPPPWERKDEG